MLTKNKLLGIILIALSIGALIMIVQFPPSNLKGDPGPKVYPSIGVALMLICSPFIMKSKKNEDKPYFTKEQWQRLFYLFGIFLVYALLIWLLGFWVVTPFMLFFLCHTFSKGKKVALWKKLLFASIVPLLLYPLFQYVLIMIMPKGILFR